MISLHSILQTLKVTSHFPQNLSPEHLRTSFQNLVGDSRLSTSEDILVILPGDTYSAQYILEDALAHGRVKAIVTEPSSHAIQKLESLTHPPFCIFVPSPRIAMQQLYALFYPNIPQHWAAVTGTNGKTSITHFLYQLWKLAHMPAAVMGTLGIFSHPSLKDDSFRIPTLTTPENFIIRRFLHTCVSHGIHHVASEVSSHALHQDRTGWAPPTLGLWCSFSQDHLDYHGSIGEYWRAKALLVTLLRAQSPIVLHKNLPFLAELLPLCIVRKLQIHLYGLEGEDNTPSQYLPYLSSQASYQILSSGATTQRIRFCLQEYVWDSTLPFAGSIQADNLLGALVLFRLSGGDIAAIKSQLHKLEPIPGRMEFIGKTTRGGYVYVDYAHTPDALRMVLTHARAITPSKVGVVFGCGGERDGNKRKKMGEQAHELADWVIITDDNPRREDASHIRRMILEGCPDAEEIESRMDALRSALQKLGPEDVLLVCGKGHETYQILGEKNIPFSDAQCLKIWMSAE